MEDLERRGELYTSFDDGSLTAQAFSVDKVYPGQVGTASVRPPGWRAPGRRTRWLAHPEWRYPHLQAIQVPVVAKGSQGRASRAASLARLPPCADSYGQLLRRVPAHSTKRSAGNRPPLHRVGECACRVPIAASRRDHRFADPQSRCKQVTAVGFAQLEPFVGQLLASSHRRLGSRRATG